MMMGILDMHRYLYPSLQCKYQKKKKKNQADWAKDIRKSNAKFICYLSRGWLTSNPVTVT